MRAKLTSYPGDMNRLAEAINAEGKMSMTVGEDGAYLEYPDEMTEDEHDQYLFPLLARMLSSDPTIGQPG